MNKQNFTRNTRDDRLYKSETRFGYIRKLPEERRQNTFYNGKPVAGGTEDGPERTRDTAWIGRGQVEGQNVW